MLEREILKATITTAMPFGKYKGRYISDLPVHYLEWFHRKGFPEGKLGQMMATAYEIKINGLEELIQPLKNLRK